MTVVGGGARDDPAGGEQHSGVLGQTLEAAGTGGKQREGAGRRGGSRHARGLQQMRDAGEGRGVGAEAAEHLGGWSEDGGI